MPVLPNLGRERDLEGREWGGFKTRPYVTSPSMRFRRTLHKPRVRLPCQEEEIRVKYIVTYVEE
jgi:hypothetical protein